MVRVSVLISDDRVSARVLLIFQFAFFQLGVTKSELVQGRTVMIQLVVLKVVMFTIRSTLLDLTGFT